MLELLLVVTGAIALPILAAGVALGIDVLSCLVAGVFELKHRSERRRGTPRSATGQVFWSKGRRIALAITACAGLVTLAGIVCAIATEDALATLVIRRALNRYENQFEIDPQRTVLWKGRIAVSHVKLARARDDGRRTELAIDDAAFEVAWLPLLAGQIMFSRIEITGIQGVYASEGSARRVRASWPFHVEELLIKDFDVEFQWTDHCPKAALRTSRLQIDRLETQDLDSEHWLLSFLVKSELEGRLNGRPLRIRHNPETSNWEIGAFPLPALKGLTSGWLCHLPDRGSVGLRCDFTHRSDDDWEIDVEASLDPLDDSSGRNTPKNRLLRDATEVVRKLAQPRKHFHFRVASDHFKGVTALTDEGFVRILIRQQDKDQHE